MFDEALASGEAFLDVSVRSLHARVCGNVKNSQGLSVCARLMRRVMIPGDSEITAAFGRPGSSPFIRFRLPR